MDHPLRSAFHRPALRVGLPLFLLAVVVLVAFQQVFKSPLAYDDGLSVEYIRGFKSWHEIWGLDTFKFYRPVKNLFFYMVEQAGGGVGLYRSANLAAYYLAACGVFALVLRLSGNAVASFSAATIWAISPTCGTVAAWVSCFNINIAAASMAFGVVAYDVMRSDSCRRPVFAGAVAVFFLLLGLLSYETAIATAPLLVLTDVFRGRKVFSKRSMLIYAGIAGIVIAWLACRQMIGVPGSQKLNPSLAPNMPSWQLSVSAPYFLGTHLLMWLAPAGRLETFSSYLWDRSVPAAILPAYWMVLAGGIYLGIRFWKRAPLLIFGAAWFFIASFPSGNFVPFRNTPYADYYVPIPSIGLCIMLAAILRAAFRRLKEPNASRPAMIGAVATILGLAGWRLAQIPVLTDWLSAWEIPPRVMARTAAARPHQFFAKAVMAYDIAFSDQNKSEEVLELIETSAQQAIDDMPDFGIAYTALGEVARCRNEREKAIALFEKATVSRHGNVDTLLWAHYQLVSALMTDPADFDQAYMNVLILLHQRNHKDHPHYVLLAGKLMHHTGKFDEEIKTLERGLMYHPNHPMIVAALAEARNHAAKP